MPHYTSKNASKNQECNSLYKFNWVQVSLSKEAKGAFSWLFSHSGLSSVFFYFMAHCDFLNRAKISQTEISKDLNLSIIRLKQNIKILVENGFVFVCKEGRENVYILNPKLVWKSWKKNIKDCRFPKEIKLLSPEHNKSVLESVKEEKKKEQKEVSYQEKYAEIPLPPVCNERSKKEEEAAKEDVFVSEENISKVKSASDIVKVAERYISLKRRGSNFFGICPFHDEESSSFCVSPARQAFKCFGCGERGDVFRLVMEMENVGFVDAVKMVADWFGVVI